MDLNNELHQLIAVGFSQRVLDNRAVALAKIHRRVKKIGNLQSFINAANCQLITANQLSPVLILIDQAIRRRIMAAYFIIIS
jgi:hypothetical protein